VSIDQSAEGVDRRLREASRLAGSLRPEHRLETKIDMRAAAVTARLREVSELLELSRTLAAARAAAERVPQGATELRPFQAADAGACCSLINGALRTMDGLNAAARAFLAAKNVPKTLQEDLAHSFALVAVAGANPVGIGVLDGEEVKRVYVHPNAQRKGIGASIVRALELEARKRNVAILIVHASPSSVGFYQSLGYQPIEGLTTRRGQAEFRHVRMSKSMR
jgi:GNAT superfamily N-acetyltransferase